MPMLEAITLSRESWGLYLPPVFRTFGRLEHLKHLTLHGISPVHDASLWDSLQEGSSSVTSLTISDFEDSPLSLRRFVTWPAKLTRFSFTGLYSNRFHPWNLSTLGSILSPHKAVLEYIVIGGLRERSLAGFDLSDFESLEYLGLSYWATGSAGFEAGLLAPRLTKFRWSFTIEDQHTEGLTHFGEAEQLWLKRLTAAAISQESPLEEIYIQYAPFDYSRRPEDLPQVYPWDRMEEVARDIRDKGIHLSWSSPTMSREYFQGLLNPTDGATGGTRQEEEDSVEEEGDVEGSSDDYESTASGSEDSLEILLRRPFPTQSNRITNYFTNL
ncbi:hypothetical protein GQ53DRAFT_743655 [Thozetella sp. PMI_491]|nr:hypothetical protein GQ53DRAFT_743655 [Thozetella sp. PMI_491]